MCKGAICKSGHMFNSHFVTVDAVMVPFIESRNFHVGIPDFQS